MSRNISTRYESFWEAACRHSETVLQNKLGLNAGKKPIFKFWQMQVSCAIKHLQQLPCWGHWLVRCAVVTVWWSGDVLLVYAHSFFSCANSMLCVMSLLVSLICTSPFSEWLRVAILSMKLESMLWGTLDGKPRL